MIRAIPLKAHNRFGFTKPKDNVAVLSVAGAEQPRHLMLVILPI